MKKLLIIVPNLRLGGQERVAVNTAEILSNNYEVIFLTFDNSEPAYEWNGNIIDIKVPAKAGKLFKIINVIRRTLIVKSIKKKLEIDYSISFGESANIINVLSRNKERVFTSIRGYANLTSRAVDKYIYSHSDKVICCSKEIKEKYDKLFLRNHNSETLYNPYNIELLEKMGCEKIDDLEFSQYTVITHGRLQKIKNYRRLIKAFSLVKDRIKEACLIIIGEGEEREQLEELIKSLKIEKSVKLIGFRANPFAYIAKSDLYVLSSLNEGFPNALVEGMAFLPVVAVDCKSGPREILNDEVGGEQCETIEEAKFGLLVNQMNVPDNNDIINDDDKTMAAAIISMLTNEEKLAYYKQMANKRVNDFSVECYRSKLIKVLED